MTDPASQTALRVLVVVDVVELDPALSQDLRHGLTHAGYEVVGVMPAGIAVIDAVGALGPDVIIIEAESHWRDALEHVCVATQHAPRPIVLFTENSDTADARLAIAAGVSAYVVAGLAPERVKPVLEVALARFEIEQGLREALQRQRDELAQRNVVDRAKSILMQRFGLAEDEAHRRLRRLAMDAQVSLGEAARRVVAASTSSD
jgi:response regulator NasT